jgi:hypothetical protein
MARSTETLCRAARGMVLVAILFGQVGLPSWNAALLGETSCRNPDAAPGTKCHCPPRLRRLGKCCCAVRSGSAAKTCCSKRTSSEKGEVGATSKSERKPCSDRVLTLRDGCPCETGADSLTYRCADPRVMAPAMVVSLEALPALILEREDDASCGVAPSPPLPPPKSPRG